MKDFRAYWYKATASTPAEKHIHCTGLIEGEFYLIGKTHDPKFVNITGKLQDKDGGTERVTDKWLHIDRVKSYVTRVDVSECVNTCPNY